MNNCDERIEKTLNRAGQTISDLPSWHEYDEDRLHLSWNMAIRAERELYSLPEDCGITGTRMIDVLSAHYAKAVDIIDRMETALENVCGERDYLLHLIKKTRPCWVCVHRDLLASQHPCNTCRNVKSDPYFEYAGVPDNWSVDDE